MKSSAPNLSARSGLSSAAVAAQFWLRRFRRLALVWRAYRSLSA